MPWFDLPGGFQFQFSALSPTTGAAVSGVQVTDISVYGEDLNLGSLLSDTVPPYTVEELGGTPA
jgi:hypothetical protein